jgi:hypothetical protein
MCLYFDLPLELVVHFGFPDLVFEEHLQRHHEQRRFLSGQVHLPEFALSQTTANVKILQFPLFPAITT